MNPVASVYAWYLDVPAAVREPVRSFAVSAFFGSITAISTLYGAYFHDHSTWSGFGAYLCSPASVGAIALAIGATYRARQGHKAATEPVSTDASFSIPQPEPPAKVVAVESLLTPSPQQKDPQ